MSAGTKVTVSVRNNDVEFALRKFKSKENLSEKVKDLSFKNILVLVTYVALLVLGILYFNDGEN